MTHHSRNRLSLRTLTLVLVFLGLCSACASTAVQTDTEEPETWRRRLVWIEERDDQPVLMAVGVSEDFSLDEEGARFEAQAAVHARVDMFVKALQLAVVQVVHERAAKAERADREDDATRASAVGQARFVNFETSSVNVVSEIQVVNSEVDKDTDTLRAIGFVKLDALRRAALAARQLSEDERAVLSDMSQRSQEMLRDALERALRAMSGAG